MLVLVLGYAVFLTNKPTSIETIHDAEYLFKEIPLLTIESDVLEGEEPEKIYTIPAIHNISIQQIVHLYSANGNDYYYIQRSGGNSTLVRANLTGPKGCLGGVCIGDNEKILMEKFGVAHIRDELEVASEEFLRTVLFTIKNRVIIKIDFMDSYIF